MKTPITFTSEHKLVTQMSIEKLDSGELIALVNIDWWLKLDFMTRSKVLLSLMKEYQNVLTQEHLFETIH